MPLCVVEPAVVASDDFLTVLCGVASVLLRGAQLHWPYNDVLAE